MKFIWYVLLSMIFVANAHANCDGNGCVDVKITRIIVNLDGSTVIGTSGDESKLNCDAGSSGYISLDINARNYSSTYALLLSSHTTEHPIWVRTNTSGSCQLVYAVSDK